LLAAPDRISDALDEFPGSWWNFAEQTVQNVFPRNRIAGASVDNPSVDADSAGSEGRGGFKFYPGRSYIEHQLACNLVRKEMRKRGGDICRTVIARLVSYEGSTPEQLAALAYRHNYLARCGGPLDRGSHNWTIRLDSMIIVGFPRSRLNTTLSASACHP
jgi:hypothetical protein